MNIGSEESEDFVVQVLNPEGEHLYGFYYPYSNVEMDRDELNELYERVPDHAGIQRDDLPESLPALNSMLIDEEDRLWVSTIVENDEIYEWWVLEDTGELITKFEWPRDEPIEVVRNGYMYTRETDEETGLQQIVRYRIEMEEPG